MIWAQRPTRGKNSAGGPLIRQGRMVYAALLMQEKWLAGPGLHLARVPCIIAGHYATSRQLESCKKISLYLVSFVARHPAIQLAASSISPVYTCTARLRLPNTLIECPQCPDETRQRNLQHRHKALA
jgi:hypothetical protein